MRGHDYRKVKQINVIKIRNRIVVTKYIGL